MLGFINRHVASPTETDKAIFKGHIKSNDFQLRKITTYMKLRCRVVSLHSQQPQFYTSEKLKPHVIAKVKRHCCVMDIKVTKFLDILGTRRISLCTASVFIHVTSYISI